MKYIIVYAVSMLVVGLILVRIAKGKKPEPPKPCDTCKHLEMQDSDCYYRCELEGYFPGYHPPLYCKRHVPREEIENENLHSR